MIALLLYETRVVADTGILSVFVKPCSIFDKVKQHHKFTSVVMRSLVFNPIAFEFLIRYKYAHLATFITPQLTPLLIIEVNRAYVEKP